MGRIGPNAATRLAEALVAAHGAERAAAVFGAAGHLEWLRSPPQAMIDERAVTRLHATLRRDLGAAAAAPVAAHAGRLTADYLLEHRIPRLMRRALPRLPPSLASSLLLAAIRRHAWTFAGSGTFASARCDRVKRRGLRAEDVMAARWRLSIAGCPVCGGHRSPTPACDYYAATFERLFRVLVQPGTLVTEESCEATGAPACVFVVSW